MNKWVVIELLVWLLNYFVVIEHIELKKKYLPLTYSLCYTFTLKNSNVFVAISPAAAYCLRSSMN